MSLNLAEKNLTIAVELPSYESGLSREVYCVLGVPVDAVSMQQVLNRIMTSSVTRAPLFISTLNLNFIVQAATNFEFKESLLSSDLCTADGVSVIVIARMLGIDLGTRVAGSDIFETLKNIPAVANPLKVIFFGGHKGVAEQASALLNAQAGFLRSVKSIFPGFGTVDDFSRDEIINDINSCGGDMLIAALGAKNGQIWLLRNHARIRVPIRAHLGATLNFQAGTIKRAPVLLQKMGFEWLWRIKEEPQLANRYGRDGALLAWLLVTRVLRLRVYTNWLKLRNRGNASRLEIVREENARSMILSLSGEAVGAYVTSAIVYFREALLTKKPIVIDLSQTCMIDSRFLGALLMLRKCLKESGLSLTLNCTSPRMRRLLKFNGVEFLLTENL